MQFIPHVVGFFGDFFPPYLSVWLSFALHPHPTVSRVYMTAWAHFTKQAIAPPGSICGDGVCFLAAAVKLGRTRRRLFHFRFVRVQQKACGVLWFVIQSHHDSRCVLSVSCVIARKKTAFFTVGYFLKPTWFSPSFLNHPMYWALQWQPLCSAFESFKIKFEFSTFSNTFLQSLIVCMYLSFFQWNLWSGLH